jgi:hypothetical protein
MITLGMARSIRENTAGYKKRSFAKKRERITVQEEEMFPEYG